MTKTLLTPYIKAKLEREQRIYEDYIQLIKQPGAMVIAVQSVLMKKYKIKSRSTIWSICDRVKRRISQQTTEVNG
ncbi:hypothetical protein A6C57_00015 [Fibrella sp. ES10-3-2-2]|nr:hypothetical protein A6C57_00015 [Fibrella sp. ES10-3-2-2]